MKQKELPGNTNGIKVPVITLQGTPAVPQQPQPKMSTGRKVAKFAGRSLKITGRYLAARFLVCMVMGFAAALIFRILKMPVPVIWGIVIAVGNFIPVVGEWIATIAVCGILLLIKPIYALYAILTLIGLEILDDFILTPIIVGRSLQFKPIIVLVLTLVIGLVCGNVLGALFAIPIAAVLKLAVDIFWLGKSFSDSDVPQ